MSVLIGGLASILFALDMLLKQHVEENYSCEDEEELVPNKIVVRKVYNKGFLLHFMDQYPLIMKGVSASLGVGIVIYNVALFMKKGKWMRKLGMAVFTAGAASNVFDRLVRGKVIDYIGFRSKNQFLSKLTINLADIFIVFGTVVIAALNIIGKKKIKKK